MNNHKDCINIEFSIDNNCEQCVLKYLQKGENINKRVLYLQYRTLLLYSKERLNIFKLLLDRGANPYDIDTYTGKTIVLTCIGEGRVANVELISKKYDLFFNESEENNIKEVISNLPLSIRGVSIRGPMKKVVANWKTKKYNYEVFIVFHTKYSQEFDYDYRIYKKIMQYISFKRGIRLF